MSKNQSAQDPEPCEPVPAGALFVPVRPGATGCHARFFRTPLGGRTAVAFTTERRLAATLGPKQHWVRLCEPAVRALATPLGVTALTVDPPLIAPAADPCPAPARTTGALRKQRRGWGPQAVRLAGIAAVVSCVNMLIA